MIWSFLINFIVGMLTRVFDILHIPKITELPLGMDDYLTMSVGYFKSFMEIMPPFQVVWDAFMFYLGFRIILLTLRLLRIIR